VRPCRDPFLVCVIEPFELRKVYRLFAEASEGGFSIKTLKFFGVFSLTYNMPELEFIQNQHRVFVCGKVCVCVFFKFFY